MMDRFQIFIKIIRQGIPCLFHLLTGLYCPGCGGTRAVWYLLHGQILKSIQYHPLVPYTAFVLAAEVAAGCLKGKTGQRFFGKGRFGQRPARKGGQSAGKKPETGAAGPSGPGMLPINRYEFEVAFGVAIVFINWIFKNYMLVFRGVDLLSERLF